MAFGKEEMQQLKGLFNEQETRFGIRLTEQESKLRFVIREEIFVIHQEINEVKQRLDRLFKTESQDVTAAYGEIEALKKRITKLERLLAALK